MKIRFIVIALVSVLVLSISPNASAYENTVRVKDNQKSNDTSLDLSQLESFFSKTEIDKMKKDLKSDELQKEAKKGIALQPYVDVNGTFIKFDYKKALKDGLSRTFVMETKEAYDKANAFLAKSQPEISVMAKKKKCGGTNRYVGNRVQGTVYIDSCTANKMVAVINGGGGASGLLALLPFGAPVAAVSVAIYALGSSVISYNNAEGKGVKVRVLRNPFNGDLYPYWIKPQ